MQTSWKGSAAVSYTHLDVYKRQEYTCGILLEQEDCMIGIPCADIGAQEEFLDDLMPVINGVGEKRCD